MVSRQAKTRCVWTREFDVRPFFSTPAGSLSRPPATPSMPKSLPMDESPYSDSMPPNVLQWGRQARRQRR